MTLQDFITRFDYKADGLDSWRIIDKAPYQGDCDDHAWTSAVIHNGGVKQTYKAVLLRRTKFYWCRTEQGESHVVVWLKGVGYVDNISPRISDKRQHKWNIRLPLPFIMFKVALGNLL